MYGTKAHEISVVFIPVIHHQSRFPKGALRTFDPVTKTYGASQDLLGRYEVVTLWRCCANESMLRACQGSTMTTRSALIASKVLIPPSTLLLARFYAVCFAYTILIRT
jgi:hypothetical protein